MNINKIKISVTCVKFEIKMEMVQEQRPQLKMKFLLGYNMKIVVLLGDKNLVVGGIFLVEEDYPRNVQMMEFQ